MDSKSLIIKAIIFVFMIVEIASNTSSPPVWVSSSFFKAGSVTFTFTGGSTTQTSSITYSSAIVQASLKVPTMGITNLNYQIVSGRMLVQVKVLTYSTTGFTFQVVVNTVSYLKSLAMTYMALDNSFTPAFSMNYFFPNVAQSGSGIYAQFYVNFTSSTGVTLNTSHENVLLPFLHYLDITSYDNSIDINLDFTLVNGSFYTVIVSSASNMYLNYAGFSRLIFDKTAIEAMGNDYFNYGIISATNNNSTALSTTIPPDILPANFYYGLHSFTIASSLSYLSFTSTYNITSGFLGYTSTSPYVFTKMKFSYMHHKTRTCPAGYPYYNITELLCYDSCNAGWYADSATKTCKKCLYDCDTCTNGTACSTCDATVDYRSLNGSRCSPMTGYFDNSTNSTVATACTSPCASCQTSATYCLSCVTGYYLSSHQCLPCSSAIPNCNSCTNSSYCVLCASGSSGATCTACTSTQYLNSSSGACVTCSTVIANCQACTSPTSCTLCLSTFTQYSSTNCSCSTTQYLSSGTCSSCSSAISYCSTCTSASVCTACISTFVLASSTSCVCNTTSYLNTTSSSCFICTTLTAYCQTCSNTSCSACMSNFTLSGGACVCPNGYYADSTNSVCSSCSSLSHCLTCSSSTVCTSCASGYAVNATTNQCFSQPCQISNCNSCNPSDFTICTLCNTGYSLSNSNTQCSVRCGDGQFNSASEKCDDGNVNTGDGCSSTCQIESGFTCVPEYVNTTHTYSYCYYTGSITFKQVWIRKMQGQNSLKIMFQLDQSIQQWSTVDFTSILSIDNVDSTTNFSTGLTQSMITSYSSTYYSATNRFSVLFDYQTYNMQDQYLSFVLSPYEHNNYPAFTPPSNIEFFSPYINLIVKIKANNNQNANAYSSAVYGAYSISVTTTYAVLAVAALTILTTLLFRAGKVIAFEMITVMQLTYFSLSFLDSINPVFSGLLPLRYLAGILNFKDVDIYLDQTTSPNCMKGIYMFLDLSDNFTFIAISIASFLALGGILFLVHNIIDWMMNSDNLGKQVTNQKRKGYIFYKLAFHFIGELALSLIIICLPLYSIGILFEAFYTASSADFWSYAMGVGIGFAIIIYFIALIKSSYPKDGQFCKLGEYLSEFNSLNSFKNFKYINFIILIILAISTLIIVTIYSDNKLFATISIIFISFVDIVIITVVKPYRFGFVSCFKGEDNETEVMFEKIELYRVYDKEQPQVIRIQNPDITQKSEDAENNSEVFAQHFATRKNMIKTKHQGLIQAGEVLNHTKLILFNNNFRRIFNLITLIVVEFVFACTAIFKDEINQNYASINMQVALPFLIHSFLFLNVIYNYTILVLQIVNRTKESSGKVENEPDTSSQFMKSMYTQKERPKESEVTEVLPKALPTNQEILKTNLAAKSLYDLKRPQIIQPTRSRVNIRRGKNSKLDNKFQDEQ